MRVTGRGVVFMLIASARTTASRGHRHPRGLDDPLMPVWAATDDAEWLWFDDETMRRRFLTIPPMSVSTETALAIVRSLGGTALPADWGHDTHVRSMNGAEAMTLFL